MKDGIYKTKDARYFVHNEKVIMNVKGVGWFKTTKNFMCYATWIDELNPSMIESFDTAYAKAKQW
jgi:hypothetical protein